MTRYIVEEKSKLEEVKAGWYTEEAMATDLKKTESASYFNLRANLSTNPLLFRRHFAEAGDC